MLNIHSIFPSIDGEVNHFGQGSLTIFIRLAGCNLNCSYCDTRFASKTSDGKEMTIPEILEMVKEFGIKKVTITGGEPLMQSADLEILVHFLKRHRYSISIETNGSIRIPDFHCDCDSWIVDYKCPSSGMHEKMNQDGTFNLLRNQDFIKFVIKDREDFDFALWAKGCIEKQYPWISSNLPAFAFAPVFGVLDPRILIDWLRKERVPRAIINIQLHKIIDLSEPK